MIKGLLLDEKGNPILRTMANHKISIGEKGENRPIQLGYFKEKERRLGPRGLDWYDANYLGLKEKETKVLIRFWTDNINRVFYTGMALWGKTGIKCRSEGKGTVYTRRLKDGSISHGECPYNECPYYNKLCKHTGVLLFMPVGVNSIYKFTTTSKKSISRIWSDFHFIKEFLNANFNTTICLYIPIALKLYPEINRYVDPKTGAIKTSTTWITRLELPYNEEDLIAISKKSNSLINREFTSLSGTPDFEDDIIEDFGEFSSINGDVEFTDKDNIDIIFHNEKEIEDEKNTKKTNKFVCKSCGEVFPTKEFLKTHICSVEEIEEDIDDLPIDEDEVIEVVNEEKEGFVCNICGKEYKTEGGLNNHMKKHKNEEKEPEEQESSVPQIESDIFEGQEEIDLDDYFRS